MPKHSIWNIARGSTCFKDNSYGPAPRQWGVFVIKMDLLTEYILDILAHLDLCLEEQILDLVEKMKYEDMSVILNTHQDISKHNAVQNEKCRLLFNSLQCFIFSKRNKQLKDLEILIHTGGILFRTSKFHEIKVWII